MRYMRLSLSVARAVGSIGLVALFPASRQRPLRVVTVCVARVGPSARVSPLPGIDPAADRIAVHSGGGASPSSRRLSAWRARVGVGGARTALRSGATSARERPTSELPKPARCPRRTAVM